MGRDDALLKLYQSLLAKRKALWDSVEGDLQLSQVQDSGVGDEGDAASDNTRFELNSQLAAFESQELMQIEQAIQLIKAGKYGVCESCGDKISVARLRAIPCTTFCIDCQRTQEQSGGSDSSYHANWESASDYEGRNTDRELTLSDLDVEVEG